MAEIKEISPVLPWMYIDPENGNVGVDVELTDGRAYSFSVATAASAMSSMVRNNEPYFVSLPPPIIVKRLDRETLWSTFEHLFATEDDSILQPYLMQLQ
jgi:hypothetical protein